MVPMLATRGQIVPADDGWLHEIKWDGYRALVEVRGGVVRVTSRTERDVSVAFPEFAALTALPDRIVLDAEIVVFSDGAPVIHGVAERFQVRNSRKAAGLAEALPATLMVFDLLECLGESTLRQPLVERRRLLEVMPLEETRVARISPTYADGEALLQGVRDQGLEGIVSKRSQSIYRPGVRSADWLKFPLRSTDSFAVGGFRWERGSTTRIGSLLVGEPTEAGLAYRGRVALAVPARTERTIAEQLRAVRVPGPPFVDVPAAEAADTAWVEPSMVVDVEFLDRTSDGRLRHPVFVTQRLDVGVADLG